MHIYGPAHLHSAQAIGAPHAARSAARPAAAASPAICDELSLSSSAGLVEQARALPDIRQDRVAAIRAEIAAGTFETDSRLNGALERLLDEIG